VQGQGVAQDFDGCLSVLKIIATRKGQNGHFLNFLDLNSLRLASDSLGP